MTPPPARLLAWLHRRLQHQADPALRALPARCLRELTAYAGRPGQGRRDIVRRSAGLPYGVVTVFASEPDAAPKVGVRVGFGRGR